ncbi:hypothetical protein [Neisseria sp. GT4A_CT1]|uniref:hypothetical protein n=1 Tax=Neisseria sp. GT4A_CT1 TaxID=665946 RepID=UPI00022BFAFC|nr:hypothetical protein [Neisseria sp. GT4A_CT1]EGY63938.1 hypothetical protein HMPREF1028_02479 [Neisseria sp. GT4A_CT1]
MMLLFASIFFDIALILAFGRFQAVGTLDFPDKLYPIWKWAVGAGVLYTLKPAIIAYASYSSVSLFGCLLIFRHLIRHVRTLFQTAACHH